MKEETRIGASEVKTLTLVFMGTKVFLGLPRIFIEIGATAGWILPIISGAISLLLWVLLMNILARYPGDSIVCITEKVVGKVAGFIINLLLLLYIIITSGYLLRELCDAVLITALPQTPISIVAILFIVTIFLACYIGLEPIVRSTYIIFPLILVGTFGILLSMLPVLDFTQMYPLFGSGLKKILMNAATLCSAYGEVIILIILVPYFSFDLKEIKRIGSRSIALTAIFFSITTLIYGLVIPYPNATESFLPFYQMARSIDFGRFFHRLEAAFILIWTFAAYIRMSMAMFISAYLYKEIFRIPMQKPLKPAIAVLFYAIALAPKSITENVQIEKIRLMIGGVFAFGLPLLVLIIAVLRKKGEWDEAVKKKG